MDPFIRTREDLPFDASLPRVHPGGAPPSAPALPQDLLNEILERGGLPIVLPFDGFPPAGSIGTMFDRRTVSTGIGSATTPALSATFAQIVSLTVADADIGLMGGFNIGVNTWSERNNLSWRLDLPQRINGQDWQEVNALVHPGFPLCWQPVHFPLYGGETVGISVRYTAGAVPAALRVYARIGGWTAIPRVRTETPRGRILT